jgi:hypothetical protein
MFVAVIMLVSTSLITSQSPGWAAPIYAPDAPQADTATYTLFFPTIQRNPPLNTVNRIIIDHNSVDQFANIPNQYITAASQIHQLFRHASVGNNISQGLDCLMDNVQPRPYSCDSGLSSNQIIYDPKYNRSNWIFEFHQPPPSQNPAWYNKVYLFMDRVNGLGTNSPYAVYGFKFGYVDGLTGSEVADEFFQPQNSTYPTIYDLEALEDSYPNKTFVYWTMGLARSVGTPESLSFNQQLRAYAATNNKILMDIADIQSHRPDGTPCFDNQGHGIEAICDEYTDEVNAGHLNSLGMQRMAKAMWVLMARLAGWNP